LSDPVLGGWVEAIPKIGGWSLAGYVVVRILDWALRSFDSRITDLGKIVGASLDGLREAILSLDRGQREGAQVSAVLLGTTKEVASKVDSLAVDVADMGDRLDDHIDEHHRDPERRKSPR
jgi:hypothetical protein